MYSGCQRTAILLQRGRRDEHWRLGGSRHPRVYIMQCGPGSSNRRTPNRLAFRRTTPGRRINHVCWSQPLARRCTAAAGSAAASWCGSDVGSISLWARPRGGRCNAGCSRWETIYWYRTTDGIWDERHSSSGSSSSSSSALTVAVRVFNVRTRSSWRWRQRNRREPPDEKQSTSMVGLFSTTFVDCFK